MEGKERGRKRAREEKDKGGKGQGRKRTREEKNEGGKRPGRKSARRKKDKGRKVPERKGATEEKCQGRKGPAEKGQGGKGQSLSILSLPAIGYRGKCYTDRTYIGALVVKFIAWVVANEAEVLHVFHCTPLKNKHDNHYS